MISDYTRRRLFQGASLGVIGALAVCLPFAAQAQTAPAVGSAASGGLEEIVVTAQKRTELLSKTPLAISVIGQQTLDDVGARSFTDSVKTIPNVSTGLGSTIAIRGIGTSTLGQTNGTVAFHVDGIFQNGINQGSAALYDIQRIEVLRGPQGTLYGRNATAGVVNVLTNDAGPEFEAFGDASYGRYNKYSLRGVVNVPVTDDFAVRLTGTYDKSDSYSFANDGSHPSSQDVLNLRLAWHATPADGITWDARIAYTDDRPVQAVGVPYYLYQLQENGPGTADDTFDVIRTGNRPSNAFLPSVTGTDGLALAGLPYNSVYQGIGYNEANKRHTESISFRSRLRFDLSDALSLTYLMGYTNIKQHPGAMTSGLVALQISGLGVWDNDWSHELNLNYESDGIKGVLGAYSFDHRQREGGGLNRIFGRSPNPTSSGDVVDYTVPLIETSDANPRDTDITRAVFGQLTFDVTDAFRLTGGARYNWDRSTYAAFTKSQCPFGSGTDANNPNVARFGTLPGPVAFLSGLPVCTGFTIIAPGTFYLNRAFDGASRNFEKFSWKASAEYDLNPDTLAYATVATGYKAGGVASRDQSPADRATDGDLRFFKPETNINYEVGIKSKLLDNRLNLGLTAFWTDYKNLQIEFVDPNDPATRLTKNAGKSRSRGIEFEYAWAPTPVDRIQGYLTYLDAKFRDFPSVDPLDPRTVPASLNFGGSYMPGSPKFAGRISYSHIFDLGSAGTITPTAQFYYQGKTYQSYANTPATRVGSYTRSDLIVRYETEKKNIFLEGFVNNIENKRILSSFIPIQGVAIGYYGPPRTYGARLGFRY